MFWYLLLTITVFQPTTLLGWARLGTNYGSKIISGEADSVLIKDRGKVFMGTLQGETGDTVIWNKEGVYFDIGC